MSQQNDSRRKLLKSIAAGSGAVVAGKSLPESWSKPIIDSVVLPVHAETTDSSGSSGGENTCCLTDGTYCDSIYFNSGSAFLRDTAVPTPMITIFIEVTAEGPISINVYLGLGHEYTGGENVGCTGDTFSQDLVLMNDEAFAAAEIITEIPQAPSVSITGEVKCGVNTISGTITVGTTQHSYEALLNNDCQKPGPI